MNTNSHQEANFILYQFSRPMVEAGDFTPFLEQFSLERLPKGPALHHYCNRFSFVITGYDHDPRELYEVPEVRRFHQAFREAWPYWYFACHLGFPDLLAMTFSCLPSLSMRRIDQTFRVQVELDRSELAAFLLTNFEGMNLMFQRAGMSEEENRRRSREIYEYYRKDWSHLDRLRAVLTQTPPDEKA